MGGVGMPGVVKSVRVGPSSTSRPGVHDADAVGAVGVHAHVVGDEHHGRPHLALHIADLPISIQYGTLTTITELTVLDDFGRVTKIPSAAEVDGGRPGRAFKCFELTGDDNPARKRSPLLFLPPTVETTDAGRPLEDVRFLRDELANIAWAIEQRVESVAGRPVDVAARRGSPAVERSAGEADAPRSRRPADAELGQFTVPTGWPSPMRLPSLS